MPTDELERYDSQGNSQPEPSPSDYWSDDWSDDYIVARYQSAPALQEAIFTMPGSDKPISKIFVLCKDTVVKRALPDGLCLEERALNFVRSHTSIPVPKVRRHITSRLGAVGGCLLLEKIEGTTLDRLWDTLSEPERLRIVSTLKGYISQLRRVSANYERCNVPGPMGDTPQMCIGPWMLFDHSGAGPFTTSKELIEYFNKTSREPFEDSQPLVLTHNDLSMRNVIVGHDKKVWLIDWGWSGFYPPWCEQIATICTADNDNAPMTWREYITTVTGDWEKEKQMLG